MIKRYKNIVWDWNGTLLNDVRAGVKTLNHMLRKRGIEEITQEKYKALFGFPVENFYVEVGFDFQRETFHDMSVDFVETYELYASENALNPDVKEVLEYVKKNDQKQYVLSALREDELNRMLEVYEIIDHFDKICGSDNIYAAGKIERGRKMVESYEIAPRETLMIGDTLHDAEVAEALGFDYILFSGGHNDKERLEKRGKVIDCLTVLKGAEEGKG